MRRRHSLQHLFAIVIVFALISSFLSILVQHTTKDRDKNESQWNNINGQQRTFHDYHGKKYNKIKDDKYLPPPSCISQYNNLNANRTRGLSDESLSRSRAWIGNTERLYHFTKSLYDDETNNKPLTILILGGSITLGWGLQNENDRYGDRLQSWLDSHFPSRHHRVINAGVHGADTCSLAKRLRKLLSSLQTTSGNVIIPDLVLLEYAVNDYQGQDDLMDIDHKTDVFFSGFETIATCAEVAIHTLLHTLPSTTAIMFLEFRTAIRGRRTAELLHLGVAEHYGIPVISYGEAMIHEFHRVVDALNETESFGFDKRRVVAFENGVEEERSYLLPYPYGCSSCREGDILEVFRGGKCKSICVFMQRSGVPCSEKNAPEGYEPCFVPMFGPDAVHPSSVGHGIAADLIIHALTSVGRDYVCGGLSFMKHLLPNMGWIVGSTKALRARGNFIMVNDTMQMGVNQMDPLIPSEKTNGWRLYSDVKHFNKKVGWICTSTNGREHITFDINLPQTVIDPQTNTPQTACYVIYIAVLRSYVGMGLFAIDVTDEATGHTTTRTADGLWEARISVWSDIQVTMDEDVNACTGQCSVRVRTLPQMPGREGNKVKILTLSVRECEV